jgi:hypothetical protein
LLVGNRPGRCLAARLVEVEKSDRFVRIGRASSNDRGSVAHRFEALGDNALLLSTPRRRTGYQIGFDGGGSDHRLLQWTTGFWRTISMRKFPVMGNRSIGLLLLNQSGWLQRDLSSQLQVN